MCKNYSYLGSRENGGFAEYVVVPEWNLIELPDEVTLKAAALLEPMAVAVHAIRQALSKKENIDKENSQVAVMGLGTIGLFVTMFLKDMGFENVYTIGNKDSQLEMIKRLGIDEDDFCDIRIWDEIDWMKSNSNLNGIDLFFECVGSVRSFEAGLYAAASEGVVCTVGNPREDMGLGRKAYWQILRNQLTVIGTWNSSFTHDDNDDWHYVLDRLKSGNISPEQLITHEFALENIISGFELMRDKKEEYIKVIMN
jgi:L-iditol 2-dehydrogenase